MSHSEGVKYWKQIVMLLCFGWIVIWVYRAILSPIYADIQLTIGPHSNAEMGTIASIYFISYTAMQIPSGILADKIGKKPLLIPCFIILAIATFVVGSAKVLSSIYLGSFLAGVSTGAYYGAAYALACSVIPKKNLTLSNAIINSGTAVGMALGLIGSSFFVKSLNMPWNYCLYAITVFVVIALVLFIVVIKPEKSEEIVSSTINEENKNINQGSGFLFSSKAISAYLIYFATCYGYYVIVTWLPDFLETERGFKGVAIGMTAALVGIAGIPGALFFSRQADKFSNKRVLLITVLELLAALMLALVVFTPSSKLLTLGLVFYGLVGKLACDPILISFVTDGVPKNKLGTALTVFNFFGMVGAAIAPTVTGKISDITGVKVTGFYVSVLVLILSTIAFALINSNKTRKA